ncbi:MAG: glycosyltransferase 87 family protein [Nitrososphaerota archaeon]
MRAEPTSSGGSAGPIRLPSWAYTVVTVASLLIGVTAVVRGTSAIVVAQDSDLTNFFFKSANYILHGNPWQIYAARGSGLTATYPNFNPPLSIFLMAPLLALAHALHAISYGAQITVVSLPFVLLVPVLAFITVRVLRRLYPEIPETQQFLAFALIALSPLTWQSLTPWYHLEQPLMLCLLLTAVVALQARHEGLAGLLAGLALLTRTTALMPMVALGALLLLGREWRGLLRFGIVAALVSVAGMLPFFVFAPRDTIYSLVTWRGSSQIGGNSIWTIFAYSGDTSSIRHLLNAIAARLDTYSVLLFILIVTFMAVRRRGVSAYGPDAWAVIAIACLAVPMLSKTVWPYYYIEPFVVLLIWEFATMYNRRSGVWRWPVLSVGFLCVAATLSQYIGLRSVGFLDRVSVGLLEFGAMLAFAIFIWIRMGARKPVVAPEEQQPARKQWRLGQGHMFETAAPPASHAPQRPAPSGSAFVPPPVAPANPLPPMPPIQHGPPPPRPQQPPSKQPPPQAQQRPPAAPLWPPDPVDRPAPPASSGEGGWPDLWADDKRPPRL